MKCADRSNGRRASSPNRLGSLDVYANLDPVLKGRDMESTSQALQRVQGVQIKPATSVGNPRLVFSFAARILELHEIY